jgi:signal peptidase II
MRQFSTQVRLVLLAVFALVGLAIDQITKAIALSTLTPGEPVTVLPGILDLSLVKNTGAAFSMGQGAQWLFVTLAVLVVALLVVEVVLDKKITLPHIALQGMVAAGALGNLIDRVVHGWVVDFFDPTFVNFAVFNVADIFLTVGIIVGFAIYFRTLQKDHARERELEAQKRAREASDAKKSDEDAPAK